MGEIRTWHAGGSPTSGGGPPKPAAAPPRQATQAQPKATSEPADFLGGLVGRQATFYLLAPLGEALGSTLTGRVRAVRKYEVLVDRSEGALVLRKDAIAAIEPQAEPRTP